MYVPSPNPLMQWNEPLFFRLRNYSRTAWFVRISVFFTILVAFALIEILAPSNPPRSRLDLVAIPIVVAAFFVGMVEVFGAYRLAQVTEKGLGCIAPLSLLGSPVLWSLYSWQCNWKEVKGIELRRPAEEGNRFRFALLVVVPKYYKPYQIAVPRHVSLEQLAQQLHTLGQSVTLTEWSAVEVSEG